MTPDQIKDLLTVIIQGLLVPLIVLAGTELTRYLNEKIKSARVQRVLERATDAAQAAVAYVAQSYVDDLKKAGAWNDETGKEAARRALELTKDLLGDYTYNLLKDIAGEAEDYLRSKIEQAVREDK